MQDLGKRLEGACVAAGLKLKHACDLSGVSYKTLHQQISRGSKIPFETVDAISHTLEVPLEQFSGRLRFGRGRQVTAQKLIELFEDIVAQDADRQSDVIDPSVLWGRLNSCGFSIDGLSDLLPHCDLYHPLNPDDDVPHPIDFGEKSLSRKYLKFNTPEDYYRKVEAFDRGIRERSMQAHKSLDSIPFSIASEVISEEIEGELLSGCYLRAIARVRDGLNQPVSLVFTQFVGLGEAKQLNLASA